MQASRPALNPEARQSQALQQPVSNLLAAGRRARARADTLLGGRSCSHTGHQKESNLFVLAAGRYAAMHMHVYVPAALVRSLPRPVRQMEGNKFPPLCTHNVMGSLKRRKLVSRICLLDTILFMCACGIAQCPPSIMIILHICIHISYPYSWHNCFRSSNTLSSRSKPSATASSQDAAGQTLAPTAVGVA
jgi:hypothetical protein